MLWKQKQGEEYCGSGAMIDIIIDVLLVLGIVLFANSVRAYRK